MINDTATAPLDHHAEVRQLASDTGIWSRWIIVLSCFSGLIVSSAAINTFAFSVLLKPLAAKLALSRGDISLGIAIAATSIDTRLAGLAHGQPTRCRSA